MKKVLNTLLAIILLMPSVLVAQQTTTNSIYIDQVGEGSNITITQKDRPILLVRKRIAFKYKVILKRLP